MNKDIALEKKLNIVAYILTFVVLVLVGLMRRFKFDLGVDFSFLAPFHASLNALTAFVLIFGLYFIKSKNMDLHKRAMITALALSVLFLLSYVIYHFTTPETLFGDANHDGVLDEVELGLVSGSRTPYLLLLFSHITLAALSLPFILLTFIRSYTNQFDRHKKLARYVFPVWLYVAITGPICYYFLMPYYK
jgi:putative membrane protein